MFDLFASAKNLRSFYFESAILFLKHRLLNYFSPLAGVAIFLGLLGFKCGVVNTLSYGLANI
jgi:hypothetical protein